MENNIIKEDRLKAIDGICERCKYQSISWHKDLENLRCRKCNGLIKTIDKLTKGGLK